MIALIDADIICYRAAAVSVDTVDWGDGEGPAVHANAKGAKEAADGLVANWLKKSGAKKALLVFSDRSAPKTSFRFHVCPTYKANRPDEKPPLHDEVLSHLKNKYQHVSLPGLEGDDTLGLMATGEDAGKYIVVTIDKDLLTIPCRLFNPDKDDKPQKLSVAAADYNWMYQTITGDTVDVYKGAPGAGPVKARAALALARGTPALWEAVLHVFVDQFDDPKWTPKFTCDNAFDEALMNARCARILRYGDYDYKTKKVRLWHPNPKEVEWISPF
ncbi:MAG: hypothetical protein GEU78_07945 [Actinobacteria bacterium]|nr:hypothetical protein [Actinomycetota bacterium]